MRAETVNSRISLCGFAVNFTDRGATGVRRHYKFFVSCGIALIIVSIGLPWLFLHESFDLLLESSKLSALTKTAQTVITQRQNIVAFMLNVIPFVSPVFFGTGVFMSFYGLWRWSGRQVVRDKSEDLDVEKKEHELKDMTKSEVLAKVEAEVANQSVSTISLPNPQASGTAVKSYLRYEEIFFETLRNTMGIQPRPCCFSVHFSAAPSQLIA